MKFALKKIFTGQNKYYSFIMHHPFIIKMMRGWYGKRSLSDRDNIVYHRTTVPNNAIFGAKKGFPFLCGSRGFDFAGGL